MDKKISGKSTSYQIIVFFIFLKEKKIVWHQYTHIFWRLWTVNYALLFFFL